jgi:hypothetical protein
MYENPEKLKLALNIITESATGFIPEWFFRLLYETINLIMNLIL